jgi:plastocyanin domain-containing protein
MRVVIIAVLVSAACKEAPPSPAPPAAAAGVREITVTAKGFEPERVQVPPSQPVVLRFTRKVAETCADAVEVQGDPVRHMLPLDKPIDVKLLAPASGEIAFACPMNMYKGAVVVVPGG